MVEAIGNMVEMVKVMWMCGRWCECMDGGVDVRKVVWMCGW